MTCNLSGAVYFLMSSCLLQGVSGISTIRAHEGDSVILPCNLTCPANATLIWKDRKNKTVLKAKVGELVDPPDARVTSFMGGAKGNCSVKIAELNVNDSGRYECHLPPLRKIVELVVMERKVEDQTTARPRGGAVAPRWSWAWAPAVGLLLM